MHARSRPARRTVLRTALAGALGTGLGATALGGCGLRWSRQAAPAAAPGPDDDAREAAVADARALAGLAAGLAAVPADPGATRTTVQAAAADVGTVLAAHLRALGAGTTSGITATVPASPTAAVAGSAAAEPGAALAAGLAEAAGRRLADAGATSGGLARLLVSLAAGLALLADTVAVAAGVPVPEVARPASAAATAPPSSPAAGTPTAATGPTATVQRVLAGEHAAVHAYGLVAGQTPARRVEALADLAAHRVARDELTYLLRTRGADPVVARPGYDAEASGPAAAAALAATVEGRLAALYSDAVADDRTDRDRCADGVLRAARAAHRWGARAPSFPGLAELGDDGAPRPTVTATTTAPAGG